MTFIMPAVLVARASAEHQMLMREIEHRCHDAESAVAAAAADATTGLGSSSGYLDSEAFPLPLEGSSPGARWNKVCVFFLLVVRIIRMFQNFMSVLAQVCYID